MTEMDDSTTKPAGELEKSGSLQSTGTDQLPVMPHLISQITVAQGFSSGLEKKVRKKMMQANFQLIDGIKPQDEIEAMLAAQMVATHNTVISCVAFAMDPKQTSHACDQYLKHAEKLMATYTRQMAALDKYRGKGQQKIRIEHVNVEAGGQAMVGHIETGANQKPRRRAAKRTPKAIPDNPGQTLDMAAAAPEPAKRRKN